VAAERSVLASVRAFHFLHKVRFGGLSYATRSDLNSDNSDCEQDDSKDGEVAKRKSSESRVSLTLGNTDADSSADSEHLKQNPGQHTGPHRRRVEPCPLERRPPGLVGQLPVPLRRRLRVGHADLGVWRVCRGTSRRAGGSPPGAGRDAAAQHRLPAVRNALGRL
jgi:hypothetical protein